MRFGSTGCSRRFKPARTPTLRERHSRRNGDAQQGLTLGDLAIAVGTKLTIVPLVVQRVDARLKGIGKVFESDRSRVRACLEMGAVYHLPDGYVATKRLLISIHSSSNRGLSTRLRFRFSNDFPI